jgi:fermentation-respiration switch protein FrsA (DUF1100 family)
MTPSRWLVCAIVVTACRTIVVQEGAIITPVPDRPLTAGTTAAQLPDYSFEEHRIVAADGNALHAVLLRRPYAPLTVLFFGGNQYRISEHGLATARTLAPMRTSLMVVDLRGYGRSEGKPTLALLLSDALVVFDSLAALPGIDARSVVVHGHSLGSFLAGHVAANRSTGGVVLQSSVTTAEEWTRLLPPWWMRPFVRMRPAESLKGQGNLGNVRRLDEPLLVLVGSEDRVTPPRLSSALYRAATLPPGRKRLAILDGAGHNDLDRHDRFREVYESFLSLVAGTAGRR